MIIAVKREAAASVGQQPEVYTFDMRNLQFPDRVLKKVKKENNKKETTLTLMIFNVGFGFVSESQLVWLPLF